MNQQMKKTLGTSVFYCPMSLYSLRASSVVVQLVFRGKNCYSYTMKSKFVFFPFFVYKCYYLDRLTGGKISTTGSFGFSITVTPLICQGIVMGRSTPQKTSPLEKLLTQRSLFCLVLNYNLSRFLFFLIISMF